MGDGAAPRRRTGQPHRLAVVERLDLGEFLGVILDRPRQGEHQRLAPGRGHRAPRAGERLAGGGDGALDILRAGLRDLGDLAPGGRVERRERGPVGGLERSEPITRRWAWETNARAPALSASGRS